MHIEPGNKVRLTDLRTNFSGIGLVTAMDEDSHIIHYVTNIKGKLVQMFSNVGDHTKIEWVTTVCDRCLLEANPLTMSMFNTEICCTSCIDKEKAHKLYKQASSTENQHCLDGDFNYPGTGLPDDLKPIVMVIKEIPIEKNKRGK